MPQITYTTIIHQARARLHLSLSEYCVADMISKMSNNKDYPYCVIQKQTMADCAGLTRRSIINIINSLEEKGLVERNDKNHLRTTEAWTNNVDLDSEKTSQQREQTSQEGVKEFHSNCEKTSHNNNKIIINDNNNNKELRPEYLEIIEYLKKLILQNNPKAIVKTNSWYDAVRLMIERDERTANEIKELILWSQENDFWHKNILSMGTLRDKFDRLTVEKNNKKTRKPSLIDRERSEDYVVTKKPLV